MGKELASYPGPKRAWYTLSAHVQKFKNNGHSPKSGKFVYLLRITFRSHGDLLAGKHSLASATPERDSIDLWFGVFTSAQPPTSECLLAFANFCPVISHMRTQYPPGPILGLGTRLEKNR